MSYWVILAVFVWGRKRTVTPLGFIMRSSRGSSSLSEDQQILVHFFGSINNRSVLDISVNSRKAEQMQRSAALVAGADTACYIL